MSNSANTQIEIRNRLGLHARPAMMFVETASQWTADVKVRRADQDEVVDGKSIMQLMMLAATKGTVLEVSTSGTDAHEALASLVDLVESGFEDDE